MDQLLLLAGATSLGFRHGIDWDHLAAIVDITGATSAADSTAKRRAMFLAVLYALGHAFVVVVLGAAAILFALILPKQIDFVMERIVGATLIVLACVLIRSLFVTVRSGAELQLQSRWMLMRDAIRAISAKLQKRPPVVTQADVRYEAAGAFGVGMVHGIGAETGTQVLLLATVSGAADHGMALAMLAAFVIGLLFSNSLIAVLATSGFVASGYMRPIYLAAGTVAAVFSLVVGVVFLTGSADLLPKI